MADMGYQSPPPPGPPSGQPQVPVPSNLVWAILVTLFCCLPFGIVAIVYAAQVSGKQAAGDLAGAMESSRKAKMWAMIGAGCGLVGIVLYIILVAIGIAGGAMGG